jgi:anaerobic magnesium-protoporphyrin IX monomethyl ester cyclase
MERDIVLLSPPSNSNRTPEENLGLEYLAAESRASGHRVNYIDGYLTNADTNSIVEEISKKKPEVVGMSPSMDSFENVLEIAKKLRQQGYDGQIVLGGIYASFEAESLLLASDGSIDGVVTGEADDTFQTYLQEGIEKTPGGVFKMGESIQKNPNEIVCENLDRLPFPIRESLAIVKQSKTPSHVMGSRGCYGNCSFCSVACFQKFSSDKRWRGRSSESIVGELNDLNNRGETMVKFVDDNFFGGKDKTREMEIAKLIKEKGIDMRFRLSLRVNDVTEEIIAELKSAGLFAVSLGVESFVQRKLNDYNKGTTVEQNLRAVEILEKYGVYVQMGHIMFDPYMTIPEVEQELYYLGKTCWAVTKGICTQLFAAEGTAITERIRKDFGFVGKEGTNNLYEIHDENVRKFHNALRYWSKNNTVIYDMAIDPISAPKNVPVEAHEAFQQVCMNLRQLDLEVAACLLEKCQKSSDEEMKNIVEDLIAENANRVDIMKTAVDDLYEKYGLEYNAVSNKRI